ncbi:hypothetical protein [Campylobacter sp. RM15925]|uniref:hypothetical protein n=1 Tax=Campylobacter sp. RM15925 TaxID=1705724 RepID=UPI001474A8D0|nr:hypothetical protein [Campylobacter sp. RM15925]
MASNEVKIKVIIDGHTHSLNAARKDVNELGKSLANTDTVANALKGTFGKIALSLGGVTALGVAVKNVATSGIEANRSFENLKIQLTGLISANSSNVSLLGKTLDAHSKWNLGMVESEKILKKLNETNAKTKFTLEEIAGAFNMFYATSAGQGSRDKAVQAMDSIALAAQALGKNIRDLTPMMDSLSTGTVIAASEMGSFMKIVGLTNEELKKANQSGNVYDYLIEKLAKFKELSGEAANGYEVALGSLKNELTELNKELSKPIFGALTTGMVTFSNLLRENKEDLVKYGGYLAEASKHLLLLAGSITTAKVGMFAFSKAIDGVKYILPIFAGQIKLATLSANAFNTTLTTLKRTFKTFLPTAIVFGSLELLIRYFSDGKSEADKLTASLIKTTEEIINLTKAQQQLGLMKASKRHSEIAKEILQMERELEKTEYRLQKAPVRPDGSIPLTTKYNEKITTLRADIEDLRIEQQDLSKTISDYTQALYEGANSIADGLKNTTKDVITSS